MKTYKSKSFWKTTNTLRSTSGYIKDKIPYISILNCVYRLGCHDYDAFYIAESLREISTRNKNHVISTTRSNNPVELENLQVKSAIVVYAIFSNHQSDIKNTKLIQKGLSNYKER